MEVCKRCSNNRRIVKNGLVRGKQRYRCSQCGYNFVLGDGRQEMYYGSEAKALAVLMYGMMKNSYGMIAKLFKTSRKTVYCWIKSAGQKMPDPIIENDIQDLEFDEMWHFIQSKKTKFGFGKHWTVAKGKPLPGLSVIVMLKHSEDFMKK